MYLRINSDKRFDISKFKNNDIYVTGLSLLLCLIAMCLPMYTIKGEFLGSHSADTAAILLLMPLIGPLATLFGESWNWVGSLAIYTYFALVLYRVILTLAGDGDSSSLQIPQVILWIITVILLFLPKIGLFASLLSSESNILQFYGLPYGAFLLLCSICIMLLNEIFLFFNIQMSVFFMCFGWLLLSL